ncbi:MAG: hypothetical protein K2K14_03715 [Ruminococcus sp.]|nr:hypothetical protein [Ruminococcus sp.]
MLKKFLAGITSVLILFSAIPAIRIAHGTRSGVATTLSEMRSDATLYEEDGRLVITSEGAVKVEKGDNSLIKTEDNYATDSPNIPDGFGTDITSVVITLESTEAFTFDFGNDVKQRFSSYECIQNDTKTDANIFITRKEMQSLFDNNNSIFIGRVSGNLSKVKVRYIEYVSGYGGVTTLLSSEEIKNGSKKEYNINNILVTTTSPVVVTTTTTTTTKTKRSFSTTTTTTTTKAVSNVTTTSTTRPKLEIPTVPPTTTTTTTTAEPTTTSTTTEPTTTTVPTTTSTTTVPTTTTAPTTTSTTTVPTTTTTTTKSPTTKSTTKFTTQK